jgi:hypothetical protein
MKPFAFRTFNLRIWSRVVLLLASVFVVHTIVKVITILLISGSGIIDAGSVFWMQLFSIQMIPTIIAYSLLAGVAYIQFLKAGRIMNQLHEKDVEAERGKATTETLQKLTAYMSEYIALHNNNILAWIAHKKDKGEHVPHLVEDASVKIAEAMGALSEISFILPYDNETPDPNRCFEILKERLEQPGIQDKKAV